ncbi:LysR family transcriptional regulator [Aliamphritea hakodatensis]|uniref:LysR family transcriptional regulator n=1 Tax=Aliamphritea hakodatensis TaxID=2895352 RepID=UPI0022FD987F|nr:LysR family transcriptional regulator [Aliamphritea hakodatensis]
MGRKKAAISGQLADQDLRLLRVFKSVAEAGGFSAAEVQLNLANSTISNYIADLEKRLGMRLCERGRGGFSLTQQGQTVYEATLELLNALDQFSQRLNRSAQGIYGRLHLAFAEHMLGAHNAFVVEALDLFTRQAPEVNIEITTLSSDEVTTAVLNKQVDIGITVEAQRYHELNAVDLFDEQMLLYCGQQHPLYEQAEKTISPETLRDYRFVESPRLLPGREVHPDMRHWHRHAKAHHQEARATLILSGQYLGLLPEHFVASWGLGNKLRPLMSDTYGYRNSYRAIWPKKTTKDEIIEVFLEALSQARSTATHPPA